MKGIPPDIDISRELDIFSKAHFEINGISDTPPQQDTSTAEMASNHHHHHRDQNHLSSPFFLTASSSTPTTMSYSGQLFQSSSSSQTIGSTSDTTNDLLSLENHQDVSALYDLYQRPYRQHRTPINTENNKKLSESSINGHTTPMPSFDHHNRSSSLEKKQYDHFLSMMNIVDQRLKQLGNDSPSNHQLSATNTITISTSPLSSLSSPSLSPASSSLSPASSSILSSLPIVTSVPLPSPGAVASSPSSTSSSYSTITAVDTKSTMPGSSSSRLQHPPRRSTSNRKNKGKATAQSSSCVSIDIPYDDDEGKDTNDQQALYVKDKRRRNTEASARFRIKKKLREQALRRTAEEMTQHAQQLQTRVHELEREVKWLRELIVEKKQARPH
ncbi:uncharacterized protein BX664DRAFT_349934 [Halteromyces radiatus]|uniref:uncharacterized protein n=1 Tax=Halteromyces radiatus TaxID=101107 RepID=UPI0022201B40|nr:uncharacterized protein BX664DRAFT_349934 [Halteromyces radiatus]KAI8089549.1 hypothetical protein BX664DRAFT_349934 [Halteromyces radiatus]